MRKIKKRLPQIILCAILLILCIIMLLPFSWMLSTSLRLPKESFSMPPSFIPTSFHYDNYLEVFRKFPFGQFILNSVIVAVFSISINFISTSMASYAFARIDFKGKNVLFLIFLAGIMIPSQATMIPVFLLMKSIGLVGNYFSLILPAVIAPMGIFLQRQYMMSIPKSYDEAAYIDGAGRVRIFFSLILPMSKPVLILTTLQCFLGSWNNFMGPLIYLSDWDQMTLPMGIKILSGMRGNGSISVILAGVIISLLVPTLIYFCFSKYLIKGVSIAGIKG